MTGGSPNAVLGWMGLQALGLLLGALANRLSVGRTGRLSELTRERLTHRVVTTSLVTAPLRAGAPGNAAAAKLVSQVESVRRRLGALLAVGLDAAVLLFGTLIGLSVLAPETLVVVVPCVAAALGGLAWQLGALVTANSAALTADEDLSRRVSGSLHAFRDILALGAQDRARRELHSAVDQQARALEALARTGLVRGFTVGVGGYLPVVVLLALTPYQPDGHGLSTGELAGTVTYLLTGLVPAIRGLVQSGGSALAPFLAAHRRLHHSTSGHTVPERKDGARIPPLPGLAAESVSFRYGHAADWVVRDLDLRLNPGERMAVVGPSGVGKSSLAWLLTGLLPPTEGTVSLGGIPLPAADTDGVHRAVALVPQESYVFRGTLRENVCLFAPKATDEQIQAAAAEIGATEAFRSRGGLDAQISRHDLSAAERQWVALVRVHLTPAAVVVLDEATSSLDPQAEARAEQAFADRGGVLVVIAHRVSTAERSDRVLFLHNGRALYARHAELLSNSVEYAAQVAHGPAQVLPRTVEGTVDVGN
ncbi:ABC transporter ATP-binding protein [Streptomyces sp. MI02-7b]|uniref:ABC transporter ATP-binding protein n=1 Tax=Streptomyces sp. MI02-7b TaxID=462941 RepID=UPI0029BF6725|nr:ABC transporter ATP-binding protein [Streptomyces sp. MI02-7b]MDX3078078.1 ABC transporter ATP-binding protein [Streptomyces sp. MI02-7b]